MGVVLARCIRSTRQGLATTCTANSKGLFAYYQYAEASFILTCRTQDGGGSDVFNLGTGVGTTVAEIAGAVERRSGRPLHRTVVGRREGDPPALVAAAGKARRVLGWTPTQSDIDNIVETAWLWHERDLARQTPESSRP